MNFGLAITTSFEISLEKGSLIQSLSDDLKEHFKNKNYGSSIQSFTIGIICCSPKFDQFYTDLKPKYTKGKRVIKPDGIPFTLEDNFEYSTKLDFYAFKDARPEDGRKLLSEEILSSLTMFDKAKSRIKDFDIQKFKSDLEDYFVSQGLIKPPAK